MNRFIVAMFARTRALAPEGTSVWVLAGKSVAVRNAAGARGSSSTTSCGAAAVGAGGVGAAVISGVAFVSGGSGWPPGSTLRGSVG